MLSLISVLPRIVQLPISTYHVKSFGINQPLNLCKRVNERNTNNKQIKQKLTRPLQFLANFRKNKPVGKYCLRKPGDLQRKKKQKQKTKQTNKQKNLRFLITSFFIALRFIYFQSKINFVTLNDSQQTQPVAFS